MWENEVVSILENIVIPPDRKNVSIPDMTDLLAAIDDMVKPDEEALSQLNTKMYSRKESMTKVVRWDELAWRHTAEVTYGYFPPSQPPPYNRTKVPSQAHKYQTSQQNPFLRSSVSFPSTCLHQAQVCRSIIPQLLSPLMELSTNKSKILRSGHTPLYHSHQLYSFPPLQSTLSFSQSVSFMP